MRKKTLATILTAMFIMLAVGPAAVVAQTQPAEIERPDTGVEQLKSNLVNFGDDTFLGSGEDEEDLKGTIAQIINIVLGFLGIIAVIIIITSGFKWMTAGGNEQTITEARGHIKNAAIGLVIVLTSYIIVNFAVTQLSKATSGEDGSAGQITEPAASD